MTSRPRRSIGAAVASLALLVTALVAAPAAHAVDVQIGTLTVSPTSGGATIVPSFETSAQCPAGELVRVKVFGGDGTPGATIAAPATINSPKNIVGNIDPTGFVSPGGGLSIPSPATWGDWAVTGTPVLTKLNGVYTVRAWCSGGGYFEGAITFTGTDVAGATYGAPVVVPPIEVVPTAPGAPTTVVAVRGDARATVSWAAPASNGGAAISSYTVQSAPGGKVCITAGALSCAVPGLVDGVRYSFTVTAANSAGTSVASMPSNAVIPVGVLRKAPKKVILILGIAKVGKTVKVFLPARTFYSSTGSIYSGIKYTFQWKRGAKAIKGATKSVYKLVKADRRTKVTVVVVAHKFGYKVVAGVSKLIVVK
jgi:hypothetical protein